MQDARGYDIRMWRGVVTVENDAFTGTGPGQVVRGPQAL